MGGLRILITNMTLADRSGSAMYVRDLAMGLLDLGHTPIVYSTDLGNVAEELRAATVPVVDDLEALTVEPDLIHGHHHPETMTALLRFPGVPGVYVFHDSLAWHDVPPRFPRILCYVAVDHTCRDRLVFEHVIPPDRVRVLLNSVDLKRFMPRGLLPPRPQRALVFGSLSAGRAHIGAVRGACTRVGISLDMIGTEAGNLCERPEAVLGQYDLVFAKGRCALEAMAVGAAVVLCSAAGVGPMVTTGEFDRLRHLNFGKRTLREPVCADVLAREIARYDPQDAAEVSRRIRATAGFDVAIDELVTLYQEILEEHGQAGRPDLQAEARAAAAYLRWLTPALRDAHEAREQLLRMTSSLGWRLLRRYGPIKYRVVLPAFQRIRRLLRPGTPK